VGEAAEVGGAGGVVGPPAAPVVGAVGAVDWVAEGAERTVPQAASRVIAAAPANTRPRARLRSVFV
jgi:hypothetical protein